MKISLLFLAIVIFNKVFIDSGQQGDSDLCMQLYEMSVKDQKYRGSSSNPMDKYLIVLDSLISSNGMNKEDLPEQHNKLKKQAWQMARERTKPLMAKNDSLRRLQLKMDEENTKALIHIVKKRGWVTSKMLKCEEKFKTVIVFRHAPKKYWKEIRPLIEQEKSAKRLSEYEYYIIDNHLKGRPPLTKKSSDFTN